MKPEGRNANEILANEVKDHSSWHFFQSLSWLDFAKRTQRPSALHYAAFELRYGVEYLLFQLLILSNKKLTEAEYQKCIGDPKEMKKLLRSSKLKYEKSAEFTRILLTLDQRSPNLRIWKLDELFRYWGIASEFLHFVGAQSRTYSSNEWFCRSLARLEEVVNEIWRISTETIGIGLLDKNSMEPEVHQAWIEFSAGTLNEEGLKLRMQIAQPMLVNRLRRKYR